MLIRKRFNSGLGTLPTSLFVDLSAYGSVENLYKDIIKFNHSDIIFFNIGEDKINDLRWLCPRLISENNFISLVFKYDILPDIPCNRVICFLNLNNFDLKNKKESKLEFYSEQDLLVIYFEENEYNLTKLNDFIELLKHTNFKGKVLFNNLIDDWDTWTEDDLIDNGIDYIYRYDGIIL